jgi:site-specific DNA-methyltransferase (adenine-specific)
MVARLMGDDLADCLWTDPPYGVDYEGKRTLRRKIENDVSDGLAMMLLAVFTNSDSSLRPGAPIYIASPGGPRLVDFLKGFMEVGWLFRQGLVWVKDSFVVGHSDYHYRHEQILFGYKPGEGRLGRGGPGWFGDNKQDSVFDVVRPYNSKEHPTMKPVELIERCLANSTEAGQVVFDPFSGSGTTLMACEKTGRRCVGMELAPQYVDVIVERWENFTGKRATRLGTD